MQKLVLSVLVLALSLQLAYGWYATGHMLTAQIAWKYLNQNGTASKEVLHALENAVTSLLTYTNDSNTFVTAAVWMDDLKSRNLNQYDNWHFINLPICDFGGVVNGSCNTNIGYVSIGNVLSNEDVQQVLWAISEAYKTITGKSALGYERGFALRNLLHLVGDLHQPLHVANRFSVETPYGDAGGNDFYVYYNNQKTKLHSLWDSGIGMLHDNLVRPLNSSDAKYLSDLADQLMARAVPLIASIGNGTNVTNWAMRSYNLAVDYSYNITFNETVSPDYITASWEVVQDQLALGGYRLALLLKQMLPCDGKSCPESEAAIVQEGNRWKIAGISLAVVLGISVVLNLGLFIRSSRRSKYEPVH